jgi:hypothetical protein
MIFLMNIKKGEPFLFTLMGAHMHYDSDFLHPLQRFGMRASGVFFNQLYDQKKKL